ncbi:MULTISPECIES: c-type cytochrome [unclassified Sphingomonas]|uniref:c-type cytochrome n=1 Tax=unclassified Sphingomonas TaxID=196159 RepID=UPI0006F7C96C|nr:MULTISPECIES: c-type cytochrome [unclassified Sphingomonas]KQX19514.1 class I cytochrome c [Sphingomonas sp. Root1294]KQY65715.1 class I cytochrome c [Sphingomonas sp. Root50]KRB94981.1 class I cytochrome c [Sphingomonas sp. Root720]
MRAPVLLIGAAAVAVAAAGCSTAHPAPEIPPQVARGQAYYVTCQGCHGNAGEGFSGMKAPRLAGLAASYVAEQLMLYRKDLRGGPADFQGVQMNGRAKALPNQQAVADVAAYIATLPVPPAPTIAAMKSEAGADLYRSCAACHGERGEGNAALGSPPLAGTDADYLARQLRNFKKGIRGREGDEKGQQMAAAAALLPDDAAIDAVAAYASALK